MGGKGGEAPIVDGLLKDFSHKREGRYKLIASRDKGFFESGGDMEVLVGSEKGPHR